MCRAHVLIIIKRTINWAWKWKVRKRHRMGEGNPACQSPSPAPAPSSARGSVPHTRSWAPWAPCHWAVSAEPPRGGEVGGGSGAQHAGGGKGWGGSMPALGQPAAAHDSQQPQPHDLQHSRGTGRPAHWALQTLERIRRTCWGTTRLGETNTEPGGGPRARPARPGVSSSRWRESALEEEESPPSQGGLATQPPLPASSHSPRPRWDPPPPLTTWARALLEAGDREPDSTSLLWASASNLRRLEPFSRLSSKAPPWTRRPRGTSAYLPATPQARTWGAEVGG